MTDCSSIRTYTPRSEIIAYTFPSTLFDNCPKRSPEQQERDYQYSIAFKKRNSTLRCLVRFLLGREEIIF